MVAAAPMSILAGFYRPYIWEALSVSLILNGLESIVLIYFTFRFIVSRKIGQRIKRVRKHEFLIFSFFFAVILAYFAGFTSILFGVLVRFKAPVLPFLVIVLTSYYIEERKHKHSKQFDSLSEEVSKEIEGDKQTTTSWSKRIIRWSLSIPFIHHSFQSITWKPAFSHPNTVQFSLKF